MIELPPPVKLREIAGRLLASDEGHTYRTRRGEPEYIEALQTMLAKAYRTTVPQKALLATSGVTGALFASLQMAHGRGVKRIGVTNPFYTYHGKHIELTTGHKPVFVQLDHQGDTFDFDWDSLEKQLKEGMGAIIVCNPGNPSGKVGRERCAVFFFFFSLSLQVYSREVLSKLAEATGRHNCFLIMDEIYADLVWKGNEFYSPVQDTLHKHVIACRGFSKNVACQR